MIKNIIILPRNGRRSRSLTVKKSQCNGSEWPKNDNLAFKGLLDLGGL